jgi:putative FmdB family regulatory protein
MPLYEYQCESCGARFEVIQKFTDPVVGTCKTCGGTVRRLLSAPAIQFKGTGWYVTDYARKGMKGSDSDTSSSTPTSGAAADKPSGAADKPSASADTKSTTPSGPATPTPSKS